MSLSTTSELSKEIAKYLKTQFLVNNASKNTIFSYLTDLNQLLALNSGEKITICSLSETISFKINKISPFKPGSKSYIITTNDFRDNVLMGELISQALHFWGELSPSSRNRKTACLKSFFKWLFKEKQTLKDFSDQVHCPKVPRKIPNFLTVDEIISLFNCLEQSEYEKKLHRDRALIYLLYCGGLRVSEACEVKWKDVDFDKHTLLIKGKGGKFRIVTPAKVAFKILTNLNKTGAYIFGEKPLNTRTAYSIVRSWGHRAGILRPISPHALRHSFATHLLSSGANLRALQELLGHSSLTATEKYTHITTDELQNTLNNFHPLGKKS